MEKILHIAEQIVAEIEGTKHVDVLVKTALGLTKNAKVSVGSSLIRLETDNLISGDVYKTKINGHPFFYIVRKPIDGNMAFCITVYPVI